MNAFGHAVLHVTRTAGIDAGPPFHRRESLVLALAGALARLATHLTDLAHPRLFLESARVHGRECSRHSHCIPAIHGGQWTR